MEPHFLDRDLLHEMKKNVIRSMDPVAWVKRYPWPLLGSAFIAGYLVSSGELSREEQKNLPPERKTKREFAAKAGKQFIKWILAP